MSKAWARLTCVGDKEKSKNRTHNLTEREWSMGRKTSCSETLADNIISSVHCRIRLERSEHGVDVVLEDLSSNGTHVNGTRVGKHNTYALQDKDEIGIGTPVVGGKAEHYGYVFHDLRRELEYDYLQSLLAPPASSRRSSAAPPSVPRDGGMGHLQLDRAPTVAVMPVDPLAEDVYGTAPELALDDGADEDVVPELQNALALGGTLTGAIVGTLANPNPSTMGTLKNTLQRGRLDISEFVDSEGPPPSSTSSTRWRRSRRCRGSTRRCSTQFGAIVGATFGAILRNSPHARRALSQVLDGALDSLRLMLSAEEGARSLLEAEGAIDRLVALINRPAAAKQTASALQIMARLVLISDKPLVESALARANRFRGARVGTTLVDLLKDRARRAADVRRRNDPDQRPRRDDARQARARERARQRRPRHRARSARGAGRRDAAAGGNGRRRHRPALEAGLGVHAAQTGDGGLRPRRRRLRAGTRAVADEEAVDARACG